MAHPIVNETHEETEHHDLKNVKKCKIYSYIETSGGQRCNLYSNVVHFFNTSVN
jgi:hypothetical protein